MKRKSLIENARKKISKKSEEDKSELIEIHQGIIEKILSTPTITKSKHFLLIDIFLVHEDLHIYWKNQESNK